MRTRRILTAVFAAAAAMFTIAACGGKTAPSGGTASSGGVPAQTSPVKYFCRTNAGRESAPDNAKVLEFIEKKTGIKIEFTAIANESLKEKIDLMIASNEEMDGLNLVGYESSYAGLLEKKAIIPINDLLDRYGPNVKKVMDSGFYSAADKDGNIWALPRAERFPQGYVPTIRGDWLEALGMPMPSTMAELDAYLAAVKQKDMNGNGNPNDEIPLLPNTLTYGLSNFFPYFLKINGDNMTTQGYSPQARYMADDGTVRPIIGHPDMIKLIAKFREWYARGYMPQDIHLLKTAQFADIRNAGTFGMQAGWYSDGSANLIDWSAANPGKPRAWTEPVPPLKDAPSGRSLWASNPKTAAQIVFFKTGKNTAHLMRYFDWICSSSENCTIVNFGLEGEHWNWNSDKSAVVVTAAGQAKYNEFFSMANLYWEGLMPKLTTSPDNPKQLETYRLMDTIRAWNAFSYPFDTHIPYKYKGTEAEFLTADGATLMEEAITKMVIGEMPLSEWDRVLARYNAIEGDVYSKVWTDQYYEFTGKPRPQGTAD
jgi:ABC-type glycerol-3-phosphate transport system substrate-binding protein